MRALLPPAARALRVKTSDLPGLRGLALGLHAFTRSAGSFFHYSWWEMWLERFLDGGRISLPNPHNRS